MTSVNKQTKSIDKGILEVGGTRPNVAKC